MEICWPSVIEAYDSVFKYGLPPLCSVEPRNKRAVDVGCGTGELVMEIITKRWEIQKVEGFDIDPESISIAQTAWDRLKRPTSEEVARSVRPFEGDV